MNPSPLPADGIMQGNKQNSQTAAIIGYKMQPLILMKQDKHGTNHT